MGNDLIRSAKDYSLNTTIERLENINKFILDDKGRVKECFASLLDTNFKSSVRLKAKQDEYRYNQFCSMWESLADYLLFSREEKERNNQEREKYGIEGKGYSYLTAERQGFINDKECPYSPCNEESPSSKVENNSDSPLQKKVSNTISQSFTNVYHKKKREQEENRIYVERGKMFAELYQRIDKEPHNREEIQRQIETLENTKVLVSDLKIHINYISRDSRFIYELDNVINIYNDAIKRGTFQNSALQPTQQSINGYTYQIHEDGEKISSNKLGLLPI